MKGREPQYGFVYADMNCLDNGDINVKESYDAYDYQAVSDRLRTIYADKNVKEFRISYDDTFSEGAKSYNTSSFQSIRDAHVASADADPKKKYLFYNFGHGIEPTYKNKRFASYYDQLKYNGKDEFTKSAQAFVDADKTLGDYALLIPNQKGDIILLGGPCYSYEWHKFLPDGLKWSSPRIVDSGKVVYSL